MRALGVELPGLSAKKIERRPYPPGQHGQARKKITEYGRRLQEKQKIRFNYGLGEKQFRGLMVEARASKAVTSTKLIELLERRLDNVVFRAGFARTIPAARQFVNHGHILVDGRRVDIASYRVNVGQTITIRTGSADLAPVVAGLARSDVPQPSWLDVDRTTKTAKMNALPDETSVPFAVELQLVVEFYSQSL
jgi:small subunit ribosomal protein S4